MKPSASSIGKTVRPNGPVEAHRFFQSGPFRPSNVTSRAAGLVFAGSGTVPGVGVPMVLLSGRLAADRVESRG